MFPWKKGIAGASAREKEHSTRLSRGRPHEMDDQMAEPARSDETPLPEPDISHEPVIEVEILDELREVLGEALGEVVGTYLHDGSAQIADLVSAAEIGDGDALGRVCHALKSSSGNLGAQRLSVLCRDLETRSRSGGVDGAAARVARIRTEFDRVSADLQRLLAA
jgi:HPt (histidine-containing phosphotransfer) domain-containing protein